MERIGLKTAIEALRTELTESILTGIDQNIRFEVGQITLEFQVEIEREMEGTSGIKFWVVEIGAKGSRNTTNTHKIIIPLKPIRRSGGPVLTGSDDIPQ